MLSIVALCSDLVVSVRWTKGRKKHKASVQGEVKPEDFIIQYDEE